MSLLQSALAFDKIKTVSIARRIYLTLSPLVKTANVRD
jgi:hypothetical protein